MSPGMITKKDNWKMYLNEFTRVRRKWEIIPAEKIVNDLELAFLAENISEGTRIADLGCGQASIGNRLNT